MDGKWKLFPLAIFAVIMGVVVIACLAFGYRRMATAGNLPHASELHWILTFNILYYLAGIYLGIVLKDKRAFCKYVCPTTVLLRVMSRFSIIKVTGSRDQCNDCGACAKICPMDILIPNYVKLGQRVLSTECIMCRTCISVCPLNALRFSFDFDLGNPGKLAGREGGVTGIDLGARST